MLTEQTTVSGAALPLQALKDHLRLGSGFADDGMQDALVESYLRAAMAAIEARIGRAMLSRPFSLTVTRWREDAAQGLPIGPVRSVERVALYDVNGAGEDVAPEAWSLHRDLQCSPAERRVPRHAQRPALLEASDIRREQPQAGQHRERSGVGGPGPEKREPALQILVERLHPAPQPALGLRQLGRIRPAERRLGVRAGEPGCPGRGASKPLAVFDSVVGERGGERESEPEGGADSGILFQAQTFCGGSGAEVGFGSHRFSVLECTVWGSGHAGRRADSAPSASPSEPKLDVHERCIRGSQPIVRARMRFFLFFLVR